ncbi:MAG: choice-of-anchor Q domain-containing protein, partial [Candidatus Cloacimonadaceae bacterium]
SGSELGLMNYLSVNTTAYPVSISNSLFRSATVPSSRPELLTLTDNIMSADPMFLGTVDTSLGINQPEYYQLSALSPCIDSGTPDTEGLNLPPMDLAGNYRIANGRIDMGVYEYASEPWVSTDDPEVPPLPEGFKVSAYPNPLLNTSRAAGVFLEFTLPKKPEVPPVIEIFNIRGQKVKTIRLTESYNSLVSRAGLSHDVKQSGEFYSTVWNGRDDNNRPLASGTYIVKAITDRMAATTKITIIK